MPSNTIAVGPYVVKEITRYIILDEEGVPIDEEPFSDRDDAIRVAREYIEYYEGGEAMGACEYRETFQSPYSDCGIHAGACSQFNGKPFVVVREITEPSDTVDEEVLPMIEVTIDGITFAAWPEEVCMNEGG